VGAAAAQSEAAGIADRDLARGGVDEPAGDNRKHGRRRGGGGVELRGDRRALERHWRRARVVGEIEARKLAEEELRGGVAVRVEGAVAIERVGDAHGASVVEERVRRRPRGDGLRGVAKEKRGGRELSEARVGVFPRGRNLSMNHRRSINNSNSNKTKPNHH
jgi:hypothetical protein